MDPQRWIRLRSADRAGHIPLYTDEESLHHRADVRRPAPVEPDRWPDAEIESGEIQLHQATEQLVFEWHRVFRKRTTNVRQRQRQF